MSGAQRLTVRVGPARVAEWADLHANIEPATVKADLEDWCLVACRLRAGRVTVFDLALFGHIAPEEKGSPWRSWLTSAVVGVDPVNRFVRTAHSLYSVVGPECRPLEEELARIGAIMSAELFRRLNR